MKALKITDSNADALEAALAEVNGRATEHTFTSFAGLESLAHLAEERLAGYGLPLAMRRGARLFATSGERVAKSYRSTRIGTGVTIERRTGAWYLVSAGAVTLYAESGGDRRLSLTAEQDAEAVARLRKQYNVKG